MDSNPHTGYECFDELIRQLRADGHIEPGDKVHLLEAFGFLHEGCEAAMA